MRSRNMLKAALVILLAVMVNYGFAAIWYVSPTGYGSANGTDYSDAWDGFSNIKWGAGGVNAGDTLYVCGTFSGHYNYLMVGASGTSVAPITIRGDYPGNPGIIDGSTDIKNVSAANWTETPPGSNQWMYNDGYSNYVLINDNFCKQVTTLSAMNASGLWYYSNPDIYIYSNGNPVNNTTYSTIRIGWYGNENGIIVDTHDYITIQSLTFQRIESRKTAYADTDGAILIKNSKYCNVKNNHITQCARGIMIAGTSDYCTVDSNRIEKSFAYLCGNYWYAFPIFSVANNVTISNNIIDGQITFYDTTTMYAGTGIELETQSYPDYYCLNAKVYSNEVRHDCWWGIRCEQYCTGSGINGINVAVHDNYIHDSYSSGAPREQDGVAFGCMAGDASNHFTGAFAYNNVIENFANSGVMVCNYWDGIDIYDNLIVHCGFGYDTTKKENYGGGGIYLSSTLTACSVYNDTIYDSRGDGIVCYGGSGISMVNNIISEVTCAQGGHGKAVYVDVLDTDFSENYNCFYVTANPPTDFTRDPSDKTLDPGFFSITDGNYHLGDSSPCIGAGVNMSLACDLDGNPFGNPPCIGCYIKNSLAGWWKFDESSGSTASDSSPNGNTATLVNVPSWVTGKHGNALSLSRASSQYASISDNASFNYTNGATVAVWVYVNTLPTGTYEVDGIWADIDSAAKNGICVNLNKNGTIQFYVGDASANTSLTSSIALSTGSWHHVACTYNKTTMDIYIDGVLNVSAACTRTITDNTRTKLIGKASWGAYYLDGYVDDMLVLGRALSQSDVEILAAP